MVVPTEPASLTGSLTRAVLLVHLVVAVAAVELEQRAQLRLALEVRRAGKRLRKRSIQMCGRFTLRRCGRKGVLGLRTPTFFTV